MEITNKKYNWISCNMGDDYWTECTITGIKIYDWNYSANDKGELTYNGTVIEFPKWFEIK